MLQDYMLIQCRIMLIHRPLCDAQYNVKLVKYKHGIKETDRHAHGCLVSGGCSSLQLVCKVDGRWERLRCISSLHESCKCNCCTPPHCNTSHIFACPWSPMGHASSDVPLRMRHALLDVAGDYQDMSESEPR